MIVQILIWSLILLCVLYAVLHGILAYGTKRLIRPIIEGPNQSISIIVAARNEESTIGPLLDSLALLQYPSDLFEVIIVNDRSMDSTATVVETFIKTRSNFRLITIDDNTSDMPHKKNALRKGIESAKFGILAFTDADCRVAPGWLRSISAAMTEEIGVVAGYSPYHTDSTVSFLRYEENKNSLLAAAAAGVGYAYMCTGRNLAYRKEVYNEVEGFERIKHSISGDDDLFLQTVRRDTQWKVRYMIGSESIVRTDPPSSFRQFVHQRTRHISASSFYPLSVKAAYGLVHLLHLGIAAVFFISPITALSALMVKLNVDGAFIAHGKRLFAEEFTVPSFVRNEMLLVAYSFLIAPLGFFKAVEWKGNS